MSLHNREWTGKVMTIEGLIPARDLGVTMPHEHLIVQGWDYRERNYLNSAYMELVKFTAEGGVTLVDVSTVGLPRDPLFFKKLAARAGVQVIMGTGYYKHGWLPPEVHGMTVEEMADVMVREIVEGVDGTGVHAGLIGEMGVSRAITATEEKALAAAARAGRATGAAISLHLDVGSTLPEYHHALDILETEGADLKRVAVDHLVPRPDNLCLCRQLAARGCFLEFDLFGQERWGLMDDLMHTHPEVQISSVKGFVDQGLLDHLLLSQNVCHVELMTVNGGDGYAHVLKNVVPKLRAYGITDAEIQTMLVENPKRFLSFQIYEH